MGKTILIAAGVFAVLFAVVLFVPVDQLFSHSSATPVVTAKGAGAMTPMTATLDSTFQQVKTQAGKTPMEGAAYDEAMDLQQASIMARVNGKEPPTPAEIKVARNDAPRTEGYSRYAALDRLEINIPESSLGDVSRMKVGCFSMHQAEKALHIVVLYDDTHYLPLEGADIATWIYGGCATAVAHGRDLNQTQVVTTMRDLLPRTPEFDQQRQQMMASLNARSQPPGKASGPMNAGLRVNAGSSMYGGSLH